MSEASPAARETVEDSAAHILIVDDDRRIRSLLSRFLMEKRFRVSTAADAAGARRILEGLDRPFRWRMREPTLSRIKPTGLTG